MKTILSAALVLGLCGLAGAQGEKADPVGTWKCEYEIGGQKRMSTLTIKKDGDKLAGTMSWPDQKETKLKDVKLKDGDLTFSAERVFMDNKFTVEYKLTITGDKLKAYGSLILSVVCGNPRATFSYRSGGRSQSSRSCCCTLVSGVSKT
jgi:hypothetical protein